MVLFFVQRTPSDIAIIFPNYKWKRASLFNNKPNNLKMAKITIQGTYKYSFLSKCFHSIILRKPKGSTIYVF